jgi:hypothetical protein
MLQQRIITARPARIEPLLTTVMRGLDPRIHLLAKRMDCRVKPGNDNRFNMTGNRYSRELSVLRIHGSTQGN